MDCTPDGFKGFVVLHTFYTHTMTTEELAREERELDYLSDREQDIDTEREWSELQDMRGGGYE